MKTKKLLSLILIILFVMGGCSDNEDNNYPDIDGLPPAITLESDFIQCERGNSVNIKARIEDKDGIQSVRLTNEDLELDKTIDLLGIYEELLYVYDLDYTFKLEMSLPEKEFPIVIAVTDIGGRVTENTQIVTTDVDFTLPVFTYSPSGTVMVLDKGERTGLQLRFGVEDNRSLNHVDISIPEINFTERIEANQQKAVEYSEKIPLNPQITVYTVQLIAVDSYGNEAEAGFEVNISEMPDFPKMYLADVDKVNSLNDDLFGVPMLIDRIAPYQYRARYYSEARNTRVRFIPQKTDFYPICFGKDPDSTVLTDEPDVSEPIILAEIGYYEISFDVQTGEYSVDRYTPTDTPLDLTQDHTWQSGNETHSTPFIIGLAGAGIPLPNTDPNNTWQAWNVLELTQDTNNKFLFYAEMDLVAGANVEFTITPHHPWGWWENPFWRFENGNNDSGENEYNTLGGGNNMTKVEVKKSGKYMFKFDTHLLRSKLYPVE